MDAQTTLTLCCSACGALAQASCNCGAPYTYFSPGELAAKAVRDNPGMSDRAISDKFGISSNTVKRARDPTAPNGAVEKRVGKDGKTRRMPKRRAERPHKNPQAKKMEAASLFLDEGLTREQVQARTGMGPHEVQLAVERERGRREAEPLITPDMLSMTAQEKLAMALRQQQRQERHEFEKRVQAEYTARVKKNFPNLDKMQREASEEKRTYERLSRERKHIMSVTDFMFVLSCLHPDSRASVSEGRLKRAFQMLEPKKFAITGEK